MEVSAILLDLLKDFSTDPKLDSVAQNCCKMARSTIKELESERDLLKGWEVIAKYNGDKMRKYAQEINGLKSNEPNWIPCYEKAPTIENTDVQGKVWFFDGTNVRRVPYYILKGCNDYAGTPEYKYGFWMSIHRAIKPSKPAKL